MIEVMFGDSEAAAMKIALKSGKGFGNDVVCLGFMLDIEISASPLTANAVPKCSANCFTASNGALMIKCKPNFPRSARNTPMNSAVCVPVLRTANRYVSGTVPRRIQCAACFGSAANSANTTTEYTPSDYPQSRQRKIKRFRTQRGAMLNRTD